MKKNKLNPIPQSEPATGFTAPQVNAAIARLPGQSSAAVRIVMENAARHGAGELVEACRRELLLRPTGEVSSAEADTALEQSARVKGKDLGEVVEMAFASVPPDKDELRLIRAIAGNPGISGAELGRLQGGSYGFVMARLAYARFGFFRRLMGPTRDQSDLFMLVDRSNGPIRFGGLRPEVFSAFERLGILAAA